MQKKKGKRINFRIIHCSSEHPEYPISQLLLQSPEAKGWQNKHFPSYPETIVFELMETSILNKIAILSHQFKISTRVDFETKVNQTDEWKKLGKFSLDSNSGTNFQARELKSANINEVPARFIRLIFKANHPNDRNIFNQIGIISISFYGFRGEDLPPVQLQQRSMPTKSNNEMDGTTMNKIKQLEAEKKRAVQQENYDLAKNIKDEIDRLKKIAFQINALEESKQQAIRNQNYEDAKIINEQIKQLRTGGPSIQQQNAKQAPYRQQQRKYTEEEPTSSVSPISNTRNNTAQSNNRPQPLQEKRPQKRQMYEAPQQTFNNQRGPKKEVTSINEEDRPLDIKNNNNNPYDQQPEENENQRQSQAQPLSKELQGECQQYFSILDKEVFEHIYSKDHVNRQKGVQMVVNQLKNTRNRQDFIAACLYVIKNLIDDKIASVLYAVINLMGQMMKKLKPQANPHNQQLVDYILQRIADYLGHINEKIKNEAEQTYRSFPYYHLTNKEVCYRALAMIGKRDKAPKILVGRLKMLNRLVQEFQLGKDYEQVIKYAVKYADDKNSDVRTSSITLITTIAGEIGYNSVQPYLKNLRPPIIKSIEEKMQEGGHAEQPQAFDEKPIKSKNNNKNQPKQHQQDFEVGNQFIQIPKKTQSKNSNNINEDEICEFCDRIDKRFIEEDYKDMHFFNACPMLTICSQCGQAIQVSTLTSHLVGECANSKYYKKCPRCKQAIHQKIYKAHAQKKQCLPAKPLAAANRCPLCHLDICSGVGGWKQHLVKDGCENNPRA